MFAAQFFKFLYVFEHLHNKTMSRKKSNTHVKDQNFPW